MTADSEQTTGNAECEVRPTVADQSIADYCAPMVSINITMTHWGMISTQEKLKVDSDGNSHSRLRSSSSPVTPVNGSPCQFSFTTSSSVECSVNFAALSFLSRLIPCFFFLCQLRYPPMSANSEKEFAFRLPFGSSFPFSLVTDFALRYFRKRGRQAAFRQRQPVARWQRRFVAAGAVDGNGSRKRHGNADWNRGPGHG